MKPSGFTKLFSGFAVYILLVGLCQAASVRVSFLEYESARKDTASFLRQNGVSAESVDGLLRAVKEYHDAGFKYDLSKFPLPKDGFYHFPSMERFVEAMPYPLHKTAHIPGINCFDTIILLEGEQLKAGLQPDEISPAPFVRAYTTNGSPASISATAQDFFSQLQAPWYLESTKGCFPASLANARVVLNAVIFQDHVLPMSTDETSLGKDVLQTLRLKWQQQRLKFSDRFQVVLCHEANTSWHAFGTIHCGLLFPRKDGWTYLEKAGMSGPFVRVDGTDRADLIPWLADHCRGLQAECTDFCITFNDAEIKTTKVSK